jgi:hypothetical protein
MKHIGRMKQNRRKVAVAYRVIPGDPDNCLVVQTESLMAEYHDTMMTVLQSNAGQNAYEFAEAMGRARLPDGRIMLNAFHKEGKLTKVPSVMVEMTPNNQTLIGLDELNRLIADQKGVSVADLAIGAEKVKLKPEAAAPKQSAAEAAGAYTDALPRTVTEEIIPETQAAAPVATRPVSMEPVNEAVVVEGEAVLSDEDLARSYRSQADAMFKEAKRLRDIAKDLSDGTEETAEKL